MPLGRCARRAERRLLEGAVAFNRPFGPSHPSRCRGDSPYECNDVGAFPSLPGVWKSQAQLRFHGHRREPRVPCMWRMLARPRPSDPRRPALLSGVPLPAGVPRRPRGTVALGNPREASSWEQAHVLNAGRPDLSGRVALVGRPDPAAEWWLWVSMEPAWRLSATRSYFPAVGRRPLPSRKPIPEWSSSWATVPTR